MHVIAFRSMAKARAMARGSNPRALPPPRTDSWNSFGSRNTRRVSLSSLVSGTHCRHGLIDGRK